MDKEAGETTYCPIIAGAWRWNEEIGEHGGWVFVPAHAILLVGQHDAATAVHLPAHHPLMYEVEVARPVVITGAYWQPVPGWDVVNEMNLAEEIRQQLEQQATMLKEQLLPQLPF